ncbi:hypothetical protein HK405_007690, partial [Cladochytrium tenue]
MDDTFLFLVDRRHETCAVPSGSRINGEHVDVQDWRMRERLKTVTVALILCLNIGIDPPDIVKTNPSAKLECWFDPTTLPPQKALETIGRSLQQQYEVWQPRARYRLSLDPSFEDTKKLCVQFRKNAKDERVLFHYNGHGVPKPTPGGEIWVFNKNYTQYIPVSIYDLQTWLGSPCIYVFDCSNAGNILKAFERFAEQRDKDALSRKVEDDRQPPYVPMQECILFGACRPNEILPMNPELPADLFTCCLTTPIEIALRWFIAYNPLVTNITPDMIMKIPGRLNDRRTPLGELNWIFTAITDTIAWNVFPHDLFKRLFRQDLMVAALFRNFLLAERIMRHHGCTPLSIPTLPSTHQHPMWSSWDLAAETCLAQLPALLKAGDNGSTPEYKHSSFFSEHLTAFEVWLTKGAVTKGQPEQLPIILQVLLSQVHRLRALMLLSRFLDLGPWAVNLALLVGIFPYVLKLLQSPAAELKPVLVFIWAKILAVDQSCQTDLLKDSGFTYFINILTSINAGPAIPNISEHRAMCAFILSVFCHNYRAGQDACLKNDLLPSLILHLEDQDPLLRQWVCIGLGKFWEGFPEAKIACFKEGVNGKLIALLNDPVAEVRAAAMFAMGTLIHDTQGRGDISLTVEYNIGLVIQPGIIDASPIVRKELVILLSKFVGNHWDVCVQAALDLAKSERKPFEKINPDHGEPGQSRATSEFAPPSRTSQSIFMTCVKCLYTLSVDPFPYISALACHIVDAISLEMVSNHGAQPTPSSIKAVASSRITSYTPTRSDGPVLKTPTGIKRSSSFVVNSLKSIQGISSLISSLPSVGPTITPSADPEEQPHSIEDGADGRTSSQGDVPVAIRDCAGFSTVNVDVKSHQRSPGSSVGFEAVVLESKFYDWGLEYFLEPQMKLPDTEDPGSKKFNQRLWRRQRNEKQIEQVTHKFHEVSVKPFETQIGFLHSDNNPGALMSFHSYEPHLVGADHRDGIV